MINSKFKLIGGLFCVIGLVACASDIEKQKEKQILAFKLQAANNVEILGKTNLDKKVATDVLLKLNEISKQDCGATKSAVIIDKTIKKSVDFKIDDNGIIESGFAKETWNGQGCGKTTKFTILVKADGGFNSIEVTK